jgi:hypothetical protein
MPKDKYPKSGQEFTPEVNAANKWVKENLVGATVEVMTTVEGISISGVDKYNAGFDLRFVALTQPPNIAAGDRRGIGPCDFIWGDSFKLADESVVVILNNSRHFANGGCRTWFDVRNISEDRAKQLREIKGQKLRLIGRISSAEFARRVNGFNLRLVYDPLKLGDIDLTPTR